MKLYTETHKRALETDKAWGEMLCKLFGANAGDVRYTDKGKGAPGSELRRLHDERMAAQLAWYDE
jgi:hypothetical protein